AAALLFDLPTALPHAQVLQLREARLADAGKHQSLMEGIELAQGGTARRALPTMTATQLAAVDERKKGAQTKRNVEALTTNRFRELGGPDRVMGQYNALLKSLPVDQGATAAYSVASNFAKGGQWHLARETFISMVDRYPSHPLALEAYRWLARY